MTTTTTSPKRAVTKTAPPKRNAAEGPRSEGKTPSTGLASPYALAEVVADRVIDWKNVANRPALLEEIFQMPYADLFDPDAGSPLFVGRSEAADGTVRFTRPTFRKHEGSAPTSDVDASNAPDVSGARTLGELVKLLGDGDVPVRSAFSVSNGTVVQLGEAPAARDARLARIFDDRLLGILFPIELGYHPAGYSWQDVGRFYNEATEFLDPVQGGVGDCYFIAALASVAWSMPFVIADKTRATGMDNQSFVHQVGFSRSGAWQSVEVTDRILVSDGSSSTWLAHSSEPGEIWPAVYEKAYAKWRLGTADDFPNIPNIAGGDPAAACESLTGLKEYYSWHSGITAAQILTMVKSHSLSGRTTTPMVAWTYGGDSDEGKTALHDANVIPGHAYSVLGWMHRDAVIRLPQLPIGLNERALIGAAGLRAGVGAAVGAGAELAAVDAAGIGVDAALRLPLGSLLRPADYIILRNPWGFSEGVGTSTASGDYTAYDLSWWRSTPLGQNGVFAMEVGAYQRYFAGTGGAA